MTIWYNIAINHQDTHKDSVMDKSILEPHAIKNMQELSAYLKKVALDELAGNIDEHPIIFDMNQYLKEGYCRETNTCQTSACAMGHYAIMHDLDYSEDGVVDFDEGFVVWDDFIQDQMGVSCDDKSREVWGWLFGGYWALTDNTPLGAAARIDHFLEHGVPDGFHAKGWEYEVFSDEFKCNEAYYLPRRQALEAECLAAKEALDLTDGATRG